MMAEESRRRFASARLAHLATADAGGQPHLVPIVFAIDGDVIYSAVDHKPKRTTALRRLANIAENPAVALLVDYYDDADWIACGGCGPTGRGGWLCPGQTRSGTPSIGCGAVTRRTKNGPRLGRCWLSTSFAGQAGTGAPALRRTARPE